MVFLWIGWVYRFGGIARIYYEYVKTKKRGEKEMKNSCVDIEDVIVGDEGIKGLCQEFYEVFWWSVRQDEVTPNVIKQVLAEVEKVLLDKFDLVDVSKAKEEEK